jgi:DNA-3-methyladenine glycosylase
MKLPAEFYQRASVIKVARELLGKLLMTNIDGVHTGGIIVETEAYSWKEKGCHAFRNRKTKRNEVMFSTGGHAYVYLCYGIHHLFNVVTNTEDRADAVLIRAVQPTVGIENMVARANSASSFRITAGPGKLTKALGITKSINGSYLTNNIVWIEDAGINPLKRDVMTAKRIGIDYAGKDALLPWRFYLRNNDWVSNY